MVGKEDGKWNTERKRIKMTRTATGVTVRLKAAAGNWRNETQDVTDLSYKKQIRHAIFSGFPFWFSCISLQDSGYLLSSRTIISVPSEHAAKNTILPVHS